MATITASSLSTNYIGSKRWVTFRVTPGSTSDIVQTTLKNIEWAQAKGVGTTDNSLSLARNSQSTTDDNGFPGWLNIENATAAVYQVTAVGT